jgi:hypothetical protein
MNEIKLLESWADSVVDEASEIRMGTPMKGQADRPLPREHDIQYQASRAHPELSPEQALALFMADELEKNKKTDQKQDAEIDHVEHEVNDVEHEEKAIEAEIARLLQLVKNRN